MSKCPTAGQLTDLVARHRLVVTQMVSSSSGHSNGRQARSASNGIDRSAITRFLSFVCSLLTFADQAIRDRAESK